MRITHYFWVGLVALLLVLDQEFPITAAPTNNQSCPPKCGNVTIHYPFWIVGSNCSSYDDNFKVICNRSTPNPKPFLPTLNLDLEILDVRRTSLYTGQLIVKTPIVKACGTLNETVVSSVDLSQSPFSFNTYENVVASFRCQVMEKLHNETEVMFRCNGYLCCQSLNNIEYEPTYINSISVGPLPEGSCLLSFLLSRDFVDSADAAAIYQSLLVPVNLDWSFPYYDVYYSYNYLVNYISNFPFLVIILLTATLTLLLSCCCFGLCWFCKTKKRRKEIKLQAKYFKGKLQQSSNDKEVIKKTKFFKIKELKKITDNFNKNRVLGEGGQGTVYKGMLTNGQAIAVKRSKTFEEKEREQFINEVILLSRVNHKNIVKLLGCCLETKLPLLVYEFIPNGTLSQHIINNSTDKSLLTWEMRIKIAAQSAGAIDYLHRSSSTPIYHRDIKSINILLDENFQAKVADFGISKAIVADKTHLTTFVQGTFGYVDPEYFVTNRFSDKSDVYSFGVVLVELLTGQQPIRVTETEEEKSLVRYFITLMNEANLEEILDPIVLEGSTKKERMIVANLAKQCLKPRGIQRPTMKEVIMELETVSKNYAKNNITLKNF